MKFDKIDHIVLLGGARLMAEFAPHVKKNYKVTAVLSPRHAVEKVDSAENLEQSLKKNGVTVLIVEDINRAPELEKIITPATLGIGLGPAWSFEKKIIDKFGGRLLNFMGIRLPRYRGGAHYTWQILNRSKIGACNLQVIAEDIDHGAVVKSKEYLLSASARIPKDYFDAAMKEEISFLDEFLAEAKSGKEFAPIKLDESIAEYYPFLSTAKQGFINWNWLPEDVEAFICAFDEPYAGASTFLDGKLVRLKNCELDKKVKPFHPFNTGVVFRVWKNEIYIATTQGALIVKDLRDENGKDIMKEVHVDQRFYTPSKYIDEAMGFHAEYSAKGLKKQK